MGKGGTLAKVVPASRGGTRPRYSVRSREENDRKTV